MEFSAGGIIFFHEKYLVLKYKKGHWGFVKGHVENNETLEKTFFREALEETGLDNNCIRIIPKFKTEIFYNYLLDGNTIQKKVVYFLAESKSNVIHLSPEHTEYQWLNYDEAIKKITFNNDKDVLKKSHEFFKKEIIIK